MERGTAEVGQQIQTSLSGPLANNLITLGLNGSIPVNLTEGETAGSYDVQASLGLNTATRQRRLAEDAVVEQIAAELTPNQILALQPILCDGSVVGPGPAQCDAVTVSEWYVDLSNDDQALVDEALLAEDSAEGWGTRFVELADAAREAKKLDDIARGASNAASPLDELAAGEISQAFLTVDVVAFGSFNRFQALSEASAPQLETYADTRANFGLEARVFCSRWAALGLAAKGGWNHVYDTSLDQHDQAVIEGSTKTGTFTASGFVALVGSDQMMVRERDGESQSYYPVLEVSGQYNVRFDSAFTQTWRVEAVVGARPTSTGAGLGAGVSVAPANDGVKVLPVLYVSGELPDLGADS